MTVIGSVRERRSIIRSQSIWSVEAEDTRWSDFKTWPTCPPTKSVWVVGGLCHWLKSGYTNSDWFDGNEPEGRAWTVPTQSYDLSDDHNEVSTAYVSRADPSTIPLHFANAYWYKPATLLLLVPDELENPSASDWRLWLLCAGEEYEYETAAEAEQLDFQSFDIDNSYWPDPEGYTGAPLYDYFPRQAGMPLCGVILRNDGVIGYGRNFQSIDMVNRGRSYLWPTDLRTFNPDI